MKTYKVGILGATGTVGQKFISLLADHPWFQITTVAASSRSSGRSYEKAVEGRWVQDHPIPDAIQSLQVFEVEKDLNAIASEVDFVFSALSLDKAKTREVEEAYATADVPVVSNNSAHRWTEDVPMMMPEINPDHLALIEVQRRNRNWNKGFIVVKPNCSIQSYVPVLDAWMSYEPDQVIISTYQAISGAGKTFETWPEMVDNIIPYIGGEEQKSEDEPKKIWGTVVDGKVQLAETPRISATCVRVPASDGHMVSANLTFRQKPSKEDLLNALKNYQNPLTDLNLPSAPDPFIRYFEEDDRPQTRLDRDYENGMGITVGRLREDSIFDWRFIALSHNTVRGAAGGGVLTAELVASKGYFD